MAIAIWLPVCVFRSRSLLLLLADARVLAVCNYEGKIFCDFKYVLNKLRGHPFGAEMLSKQRQAKHSACLYHFVNESKLIESQFDLA